MKIIAKVTLKQLLTEEEKLWMQSLTEQEQQELIEKFRQRTLGELKSLVSPEDNFEIEVKAALHK